MKEIIEGLVLLAMMTAGVYILFVEVPPAMEISQELKLCREKQEDTEELLSQCSYSLGVCKGTVDKLSGRKND